MYDQLAHLYDWAGSLDFAGRILPEDLRCLRQAGILPGARLLDVACGTGTLAIGLAEAGYEVIGVDLSCAMLAQARRKLAECSPSTQARLRFEAADMRELSHAISGLPEIDAVLCHYDSLNHLSNESELRAVFLQMAQVLRPGGLLVFDLNTEENYRTYWQGTDSDEGPNYRLSTQASYDPDSGKATVQFTADEHTADGLVRTTETLYEQFFLEKAVAKYLGMAGFTEITCTPFNPLADDASPDPPLKTLWQARRLAQET